MPLRRYAITTEFWYNTDSNGEIDMPEVMEQVNRMSTAEKLRLMECILKSITFTVESPEPPVSEPPPKERKKPCIRDFIGYGARFHKLRPTEEWMKELREGEEE